MLFDHRMFFYTYKEILQKQSKILGIYGKCMTQTKSRLISEYRIKVEHAICGLKCYKVMGTLWMHPRPKLKNLVKICDIYIYIYIYIYIIQYKVNV
jgi:hypothetical protein